MNRLKAIVDIRKKLSSGGVNVVATAIYLSVILGYKKIKLGNK